MIEKAIIFRNKKGLHARPASILVAESKKFDSEIKLFKENKEANISSILGLICLEAKDGDKLTIKAEGSDEDKAIKVMSDLIENKLALINYKQYKKKVAKEINDELTDYNVPNPSEVISMIGKGVRKAMRSIGIEDLSE
ncbi:HPr family phosphocarrier protein [Orenia marismortui]|uniref:Phosphocarrier protein HPr n=1 Tax=Orenia marismortui TaxID=46469 RepID=A0A4V3GYI8_9FIRM|nr:HPr family phosphocarrier protein [Orenia marismortui]TDX52951.1 phosphotransferase system HPr (HPr) family protein [Orenia marismortui]